MWNTHDSETIIDKKMFFKSTNTLVLLSACLFILINVSPCLAEQNDVNYDDISIQDKRAGGRGFLNLNYDNIDKRAGARGFLTPLTSEDKRGGARGFSLSDDYHSAERRAGGRAFMMPATGDELYSESKRAGGRPFYGMSDWKRAGGRLFHFYDAPMMKRAGGRGFYPIDKRAGGRGFYPIEKRAGARAFIGASLMSPYDYYAKRGGSRPFYAATSWRGYPLQ